MLNLALTYEDLEAVDPEYYKQMKWTLENDITDILDQVLLSVQIDLLVQQIFIAGNRSKQLLVFLVHTLYVQGYDGKCSPPPAYGGRFSSITNPRVMISILGKYIALFVD